MNRFTLLGPALLTLLELSSPSAWACASCFGQTDDKMAVGMNAGIYALLVVVGLVLTAFAGFFIFLMRRAATAATSTYADPKA